MNHISNILSAFHDGEIEDYQGDHSKLELKIGCRYLAEIIKEGYEYFYLTIQNVYRFEFYHWNGTITQGFQEIIDLNLEIGYTEIDNGIVKTSCHLWTKQGENGGGVLWIDAKYLSLKNQDMEIMKPETLYKMSSAYWNRTKS